MKEDDPNQPLEPNLETWIEPELEARIVALVMGEASDFEREELERLIAEKPELALFRDRIASTHELLGEVASGKGDAAEWKLSAERRKSVLDVISATKPSKEQPKAPIATSTKTSKKRWVRWASFAAAACLIGVFFKSTIVVMNVPYEVASVSKTAPEEDGWTNSSPLSVEQTDRLQKQPILRPKAAPSSGPIYSYSDTADTNAVQTAPIVIAKNTVPARSSLSAIGKTLEDNTPVDESGSFDSGFRGLQEFSQIGHGGYNVERDVSDTTENLERDFTMIGHGGVASVSAESGNASINVGGSVQIGTGIAGGTVASKKSDAQAEDELSVQSRSASQRELGRYPAHPAPSAKPKPTAQKMSELEVADESGESLHIAGSTTDSDMDDVLHGGVSISVDFGETESAKVTDGIEPLKDQNMLGTELSLHDSPVDDPFASSGRDDPFADIGHGDGSLRSRPMPPTPPATPRPVAKPRSNYSLLAQTVEEAPLEESSKLPVPTTASAMPADAFGGGLGGGGGMALGDDPFDDSPVSPDEAPEMEESDDEFALVPPRPQEPQQSLSKRKLSGGPKDLRGFDTKNVGPKRELKPGHGQVAPLRIEAEELPEMEKSVGESDEATLPSRGSTMSLHVQNRGSIRASDTAASGGIIVLEEAKEEEAVPEPQKKAKVAATKVDIQGNDRTKDKVLRNEMGIKGLVPEAARLAVSRRQELVAKADNAAHRAQKFLAEKDYEGAVSEYRKSLDLLPDAPVVKTRVDQYSKEFADSSIALARQRAEEGRYDEAIKLAAAVLDPSVDPENRDAKQLVQDLNDPEIYSPARGPEHIARVKRVETALKVAESYIRLGDYDSAEEKYFEALNFDPYNSASRRGLEDVEKQRKLYYESTYDQTRAPDLRSITAESNQESDYLTGSKQRISSPSKSESIMHPKPDSAENDTSNDWLNAYIRMRDAEKLEANGDELAARKTYQESLQLFDSIAERNPGWKTNMMDFRRRNLSDRIKALQDQLDEPKKPDQQVTFPEESAAKNPFSTFSLHVSDVSFKLAQEALANGKWPAKERIRVEEFVNAFDYGDPMPSQDEKVAASQEQAIHPFLQQRNLLRIAMRTAAAGRAGQTPLRLTILLDKSGSMERPDRVATVERAFTQLVGQLFPTDQVTLLSFARQPRLLADQSKGADLGKLASLAAQTPTEGGTNLEAALLLAFEKAEEQKLIGAQNRIVLITDGAANLGDADPERLSRLIETIRDRGIAFDAAGVGAEGLNDEILEALTRKGDGRYYLLSRPEDAEDGFAKQIAGALRPAAKNVKIQVEFNPERVGRYKLIGFEKHRLKKEDFRNDQVDAAEMAAEEAGVALYQIEPLAEGSGDIGSVSIRFRDMASGEMVERRWPIPYEPAAARLDQAAPSMKLAASAALFGSKLKDDELGQTVDLGQLARYASSLQGERAGQLRQMIQQARDLTNE